jgi:hypothetical protein
MIARAVMAAVALVAIVRVETARQPEDTPPITPPLARAAYADITGREPQMRAEAARTFPGDLWSQDDDFHDHEQDAVRDYATKHRVPIADVLGAIDDGMRARWPTPAQPSPRVAPCRPRLTY